MPVIAMAALGARSCNGSMVAQWEQGRTLGAWPCAGNMVVHWSKVTQREHDGVEKLGRCGSAVRAQCTGQASERKGSGRRLAGMEQLGVHGRF